MCTIIVLKTVLAMLAGALSEQVLYILWMQRLESSSASKLVPQSHFVLGKQYSLQRQGA